jgi:hypothetical protein
MTKRGEQDKIIQALLKKIGKALIKESKPIEVKKTPKEEYIDLYTASEPTQKTERYNVSPTEVKDKEVLLTLEAIQKDKEQIAKQKESLKQDQVRTEDQYKSLQRAKLEINGRPKSENRPEL